MGTSSGIGDNVAMMKIGFSGIHWTVRAMWQRSPGHFVQPV
jgi:hypothetical protein